MAGLRGFVRVGDKFLRLALDVRAGLAVVVDAHLIARDEREMVRQTRMGDAIYCVAKRTPGWVTSSVRNGASSLLPSSVSVPWFSIMMRMRCFGAEAAAEGAGAAATSAAASLRWAIRRGVMGMVDARRNIRG